MVTVTLNRANQIDKLRTRLSWRAHGGDTAEIAACDYLTGIAEKEHPAELATRLRRALWEQWVSRQAVQFLTELDQNENLYDELVSVWCVYETGGENAVLYGMIPEFESWVSERIPVPH